MTPSKAIRRIGARRVTRFSSRSSVAESSVSNRFTAHDNNRICRLGVARRSNSLSSEWHRWESRLIDKVRPRRFVPCKPDSAQSISSIRAPCLLHWRLAPEQIFHRRRRLKSRLTILSQGIYDAQTRTMPPAATSSLRWKARLKAASLLASAMPLAFFANSFRHLSNRCRRHRIFAPSRPG